MSDDVRWMREALKLAAQGEGRVEPNPMVGCVIVQNGEAIGQGWHQGFGEGHAETLAIQNCKADPEGSTFYVSLEPCCHHGKTPPCTEAVIAARPARVVIACRDPFPKVDGGGVRQLEAAGIDVAVGVLVDEATRLLAPYFKLVKQRTPWVIAKWAMTLDGKIASTGGSSQWISNEASRALVHRLRGRVDAIMVGSNTARTDDPILTARPAGPRVATRVIVDSQATLSPQSQLAKSARQIPVLIFVGPKAEASQTEALRQAGCEVVVLEHASHQDRLRQALRDLARRQMTNVLVEGGSKLLGCLFDLGEIDEVHAFCAPKLIGGSAATPIAGRGLPDMKDAVRLHGLQIEQLDGDVYIHGRTRG